MNEIKSNSFDMVHDQRNASLAMQMQNHMTFSAKLNAITRNDPKRWYSTALRHRRINRRLLPAALLILSLALMGANIVLAESPYPDLRDCHSPGLQKALDKAFTRPRFWVAVKKKKLGLVVADVTDLRRPEVAWYNPHHMLYAASLPKIAIALGVIVEIDRGRFQLDNKTRRQLIRMIRHSSNREATALLRRVGMERLAEILQDERYGKLYDPARGGGLWVGKEYGKAAAWRRDPLNGISHGASPIQAARFYYGAITGTIIDLKFLPLLAEIFGKPAINHKFVKGLQGREGVRLFRKSGTWREYHADSGLVLRNDLAYIVVFIDHHIAADRDTVEGIRIIDDVMQKRAIRKQPAVP